MALLHGLEQCTLHLGRGAVDFVGEEEIGENGTLLHAETLLLLAIDERTDDIGRKEVGGELHAAEFGIDELCERFDGQRFGQTGHAFEEHVSVGEQTDEKGFDKMFLPHDVAVHARNEVGDKA